MSAENGLTKIALWGGFLSVCLGNFMASLDVQVVMSSVLPIQKALNAPAGNMVWVQSIYMVAEVFAIALSSYLSRIFSMRTFVLLSAGGFTLMSIACAYAWNLPSMLVFRALQGFTGGGMIPATTSLLFMTFPLAKQMSARTVASLFTTMGVIVGPFMGGFITNAWSWHGLFLINLFPGVLICAGAIAFLQQEAPDWQLSRKTDFPGAVAMLAALGSLEFILDQGARRQWFASTAIAVAAVVCLMAAVIFFRRTARHAHPIIELDYFANYTFSMVGVLFFVVGMLLFGSNYCFAVYLAEVHHFNGLQIGQITAVSGAVVFLSAPFVGKFASKAPRLVTLATGLSFLLAGNLVNCLLSDDAGRVALGLSQVLRSEGVLFSAMPLLALAMGVIDRSRIKSAGAAMTLIRNVGGAVGLAVFNSLTLYFQERTGSSSSDDAITGAAFHQLFVLMAALAGSAIVLMLLLQLRPKGTAPQASVA